MWFFPPKIRQTQSLFIVLIMGREGSNVMIMLLRSVRGLKVLQHHTRRRTHSALYHSLLPGWHSFAFRLKFVVLKEEMNHWLL